MGSSKVYKKALSVKFCSKKSEVGITICYPNSANVLYIAPIIVYYPDSAHVYIGILETFLKLVFKWGKVST